MGGTGDRGESNGEYVGILENVEISAQVSESKPLFLLCVDLSIHVIYVG